MKTLQEALDGTERTYVGELLAECRGNATRAAVMAGIHRSTLYKIMRKHAIPRRTPAAGRWPEARP